MKSNLWILTEERPKKQVLVQIFKKFCGDKGIGAFVDNIRILPILDKGNFTFTYEIIGFRCNVVEKVYIKTVSGSSSFTDFLVFHQNDEPKIADIPLYAIEETKTDDQESRNTGVFQRCSKFVYIESFYPGVKKIMLYNLQISQKETPTDTNIFGTRLLLTIGVEIIGKELDPNVFVPFNSVDEVIASKNAMRRPPAGNVAILLEKFTDRIEISGRLFKSGSLSHDPNIGALTIIANVLRKLGWSKRIVITTHGLLQIHLTIRNKFVKIANKVDIELEGLVMPHDDNVLEYWRYDKEGEKLGTIFMHLVVESFTNGYSIFENHAGSEKGYFFTADRKAVALAKYSDKDLYKAGDKTKIVHIPDLILLDFDRSEIINIEGKKYSFRQNGINELDNYDFIEEHYIKKHYPLFRISRTVVLYGSKEEEIIEVQIGFLLNENGKLVLGVRAPELFKEAIKNLLDFWRISQ